MKSSNVLKKFIWVTFQREGFHKWPDAPDEVAFLKSTHRHVFHFKVSVEVSGSDRELEFFIEKKYMEGLYESSLKLNNKSCEMIAEDLYTHLAERYKDEQRTVIIDVSEDGENGASIEFVPT